MREILKVAALGVAAVAGIGALGFAANAISVGSLNFWGPKYEEASRKITQQSIRRQEGVSEGIAALCLNMRLEKDAGSKSAFANMILTQAGATGTELTPYAGACKLEAERLLGL